MFKSSLPMGIKPRASSGSRSTVVARDRETVDASLRGLAGGEMVAESFVEGVELSVRIRGRITWHRYFDTPLLPERTMYSAGLTLTAQR